MKFNSTFLNCVSTLFTEEYSEFSYEEYECYLISCDFFTGEDCTERTLSYDLFSSMICCETPENCYLPHLNVCRRFVFKLKDIWNKLQLTL